MSTLILILLTVLLWVLLVSLCILRWLPKWIAEGQMFVAVRYVDFVREERRRYAGGSQASWGTTRYTRDK